MGQKVVRIAGALWVLYHFLYISDIFTYAYIPIPPLLHTPMHLAGFLFFAYLLVPAKKGAKRNIPPWYDIICAVLCIIPPIYYAVYVAPYQEQLAAVVSPLFTTMGWLLTLLILEMVRRCLGYVFLGIIVLFIVYAMTASHWPGIFYGLQQPYDYLGSWFLLSDQGILVGSALRVSSIIIVSFLMFGAILVSSGERRRFSLTVLSA